MSYYVNRDVAQDAQEGVDAFDRSYFARFGRYPDESPLSGTPRESDHRRQAILNLVERGATQGERDAARRAYEGLYGPVPDDAADEEDYLEALAHGAA